MWQLSLYRIGGIPSLLGLTLLAACSQPSIQEQTPGDSSRETLGDRSSVVTVDRSPIASPTPAIPAPATRQTTTPDAERTLPGERDLADPVPRPHARVATRLPATPPDSKPDRTPAIPERNNPSPPVPTFLTTERMAGFSSNGNYYLYLESSRDTGAGIPKSTLQVIDLSSSTCVENGCVETRYGESDADLNLAEVEQDLLRRTWRLRQELSLTPPSEGTALPILSRSRTPDGSETVTVRLPNSDQPLQLGLRQQRVAGGTTDKERAAMQLEVIHNGQRRSLDSLDNYRDWVLEYSIREVRQAPDGKSIAILITATKPTFEGTLATTLVQGVELRDGG